jgi:hypothetical protein
VRALQTAVATFQSMTQSVSAAGETATSAMSAQLLTGSARKSRCMFIVRRRQRTTSKPST